jgi:hypothetical protein
MNIFKRQWLQDMSESVHHRWQTPRCTIRCDCHHRWTFTFDRIRHSFRMETANFFDKLSIYEMNFRCLREQTVAGSRAQCHSRSPVVLSLSPYSAAPLFAFASLLVNVLIILRIFSFRFDLFTSFLRR